MSEEDLEDVIQDNILEQYSMIKKTGTRCEVKEARKFYVDMIREVHSKVRDSIAMYLINLNQDIPYHLLGKDHIEVMIDDGDFQMENITLFNNLLPIVYDLYKYSKQYNAWKGEIIIDYEEDGFSKKKVENAYYVEPKSVEDNMKKNEDLFI